MNKLSKKLVALAICGALLVPTGAMASEPASTDQLPDAAKQVLEEYNDAVVAAYEQKDVAFDTADFANSDLVAQLEGRNDFILSAQSGYDILDKSSNYTIDDVNVVDDGTIKVMVTRTLDQTMTSDKTGDFPFYSATQEGYVLTKNGENWQIARVVDETAAHAPAFQEFADKFANDDQGIATANIAANDNAVVSDMGNIESVSSFV